MDVAIIRRIARSRRALSRAGLERRACLAVTRKLLKRSYHTLRELREEALAPA